MSARARVVLLGLSTLLLVAATIFVTWAMPKSDLNILLGIMAFVSFVSFVHEV